MTTSPDTGPVRGAIVVLPVIDQHGKVVGTAQRPLADMLVVEAFTDDDGTVWTPPTAWAYFSACRALKGQSQ